MMKRVMRGLVICAVLVGASSTWAAAVTVKSPGGKLEVEVAVGGGGALTWTVRREGNIVLGPGALGLTVDGEDLGAGVSLGEMRQKTIEERYPIWGNHAEAVNHCNEGVVEVTSGGAKKFELALRAFDDGAAVRASVPLQGTHTVAGEATTWKLPAGSTAWWAKYAYEEPFAWGELEKMPEKMPLSPPTTFKTPQGLYVAVTEADNRDFPDMGVEREGDGLRAVFPASLKGWKQEGAIVTPWRVAIIAPDLNGLVNSDLVTNLCPPPPAELANADWIRPGRVMWQWWAIGAPKLDDQKAWVDATKKMGWEYYLVDEGWRGWKAPNKDQWECLKEVIDYGKTQGIKSLCGWIPRKCGPRKSGERT